jgi:hypothetical protein
VLLRIRPMPVILCTTHIFLVFLFMGKESFHTVREAVLGHMQDLFADMEEALAMAHQEKLALLEDAFHNAVDADELRVAFEQWYYDHAEDLEVEQSVDELWDMALGNIEE